MLKRILYFLFNLFSPFNFKILSINKTVVLIIISTGFIYSSGNKLFIEPKLNKVHYLMSDNILLDIKVINAARESIEVPRVFAPNDYGISFKLYLEKIELKFIGPEIKIDNRPFALYPAMYYGRIFNLKKYFKINKAGNYKLEIKTDIKGNQEAFTLQFILDKKDYVIYNKDNR